MLEWSMEDPYVSDNRPPLPSQWWLQPMGSNLLRPSNGPHKPRVASFRIRAALNTLMGMQLMATDHHCGYVQPVTNGRAVIYWSTVTVGHGLNSAVWLPRTGYESFKVSISLMHSWATGKCWSRTHQRSRRSKRWRRWSHGCRWSDLSLRWPSLVPCAAWGHGRPHRGRIGLNSRENCHHGGATKHR